MVSRVEIRSATLRDCCFIAANMREQDRREINASAVLDSMTDAAVLSFLGSPDTCWIAWLDGQPVSAFGHSQVSPLQPHMRSMWAWGTDRLKRVIPAISRFCVENWPKDMKLAGVTRCEVRSIADHDIAHVWLKSLRGRREAIMPGYGVNGETFELWAWLKEDWNDVLQDTKDS